MAVPVEPIVFMKATSAICGPNDEVVIPRGSVKSDWEVELGVVIGKAAKYVTEADALSHVAGYCVVNDLSERAFQMEGTGQWTKGKSGGYLWPVGAVDGDLGRDRRPAESVAMAGGERPPVSGRKYEDDGLRRCLAGELFEPVYEFETGRYYFDGNAAGGGIWAEAAGVFTPRRQDEAGDRRAGGAESACGRGVVYIESISAA